ncbi:uncharacterized protein TrAtP1_003771 [Trichoderma atroviride]|uniref:uncharacterized protein n=1 Tax=Hypocrea atroviridis TaxID=63577 RepID=UPI00332487F3|nr:hypothetical protein TrAtP1_003771 [Trichoderma atroviride]
MAEQILMGPQDRGIITPFYLEHPVPDTTTPTPSDLERGVSPSASTAPAIATTTAAVTTTVTDVITTAYAAITAPATER